MSNCQEPLHRRHLSLRLSFFPPKVEDYTARSPGQQPVDYVRSVHIQMLMKGTQVEVKAFQSKKL